MACDSDAPHLSDKKSHARETNRAKPKTKEAAGFAAIVISGRSGVWPSAERGERGPDLKVDPCPVYRLVRLVRPELPCPPLFFFSFLALVLSERKRMTSKKRMTGSARPGHEGKATGAKPVWQIHS